MCSPPWPLYCLCCLGAGRGTWQKRLQSRSLSGGLLERRDASLSRATVQRLCNMLGRKSLGCMAVESGMAHAHAAPNGEGRAAVRLCLRATRGPPAARRTWPPSCRGGAPAPAAGSTTARGRWGPEEGEEVGMCVGATPEVAHGRGHVAWTHDRRPGATYMPMREATARVRARACGLEQQLARMGPAASMGHANLPGASC